MITIPCKITGEPLADEPIGAIAKIQVGESLYYFEDMQEYEAFYEKTYPVDEAFEAKSRAISRLQESRAFGWELIDDFTAGNMLLGIAQASPVVAGTLMKTTAGIMSALQTGSLYVAIANIKALPLSAMDGTYLTEKRAADFRNKIHAFLGLTPVSKYND